MKNHDRPTLADYATRDSYEVWYFDCRQWNFRCSRHERDDAVQIAESIGYPFWAVIRCSRTVELNSVED